MPVRLCESESTAEGKIVVLLPKFRHPWLGWLQERLRQRYFRVNLDEFGSHVWETCDGTRNVGEIARMFGERFGDVEQLYGRLNKFLNRLVRDGMITLQNQGKDSRQK